MQWDKVVHNVGPSHVSRMIYYLNMISRAEQSRPYVLSRINWADPANCPIFRQFVPLGSIRMKDHPQARLDSLHERKDSPVDGIVHRYPDKAVFLREVNPLCLVLEALLRTSSALRLSNILRLLYEGGRRRR